MDKIKLKPCPFCGGKALIKKTGGIYIVMCAATNNCPVHPFIGCYDNKAEAIDAWNRRAEHE